MKQLCIIGLLFFSALGFSQELRTTFSNDYGRWTFDDFSFNTTFVKSYDNWKSEGQTIKTVFLNDWNSWRIGANVTLKTNSLNKFDFWIIQGFGKTIKVRTEYLNGFDQWRIIGDFEGSFRTTFSNDWERWSFDLDFSELEVDLQKAIVFIAVYSSFSQNVKMK